MDQFFLPRQFQRGIARSWKGPLSGFYSADRETGRQTDRENRHYENIYIDVIYSVYTAVVVIKSRASFSLFFPLLKVFADILKEISMTKSMVF